MDAKLETPFALAGKKVWVAGHRGMVGSATVRRLESEEFDLVAVGRALLSDPAWAKKVRAGREDEIVQFAIEHMQVLL